VVLPTDKGITLKIRKATRLEPEHIKIYSLLNIPKEIIKPKKQWTLTIEK
jgi:hypothetical protein